MNTWKIESQSECGPRDENQDNFLIITKNGYYQHLLNEERHSNSIADWPKDHIRIAVADGMGGHQQGREFAESVVKELTKVSFASKTTELHEAVTTLHKALFEKYFKGPRSPGSTLVIADIKPDGQCTLVNIGDSRAYLSDSEEIDIIKTAKLLTHDHNEAEFAWREGIISTQDLKEITEDGGHSPIAQAIGFGHIKLSETKNKSLSKQHMPTLQLNLDSEHCDVISFKIEKGQCLTLASDGWWHPDSQDNATMLKLMCI